jgi:tRNA pseudouridine38-40 synthase
MNQSRFLNRAQFLAHFAYLGLPFHGVQEQPHLVTVLGTLRKRIEESAKQRAYALSVTARTDRGVHALHNCATFFLKQPIDPIKVIKEVSAHRQDNLYNVSLIQVPHYVHARGISNGKYYRYSILDDSNIIAIANPFVWRIAPRLSVEKMRFAARSLVGEIDFSSLRGAGCTASSPLKTIFDITIIRNAGGLILIDIFGNAFLRKMIRNMVGLLVEIGADLRDPNCIPEILDKKDRKAAGIMAPAHGLCLMAIIPNLIDSPLNGSNLRLPDGRDFSHIV